MSVLVLGASGLLGHKLTQVLTEVQIPVLAAGRDEGAARIEAFFAARRERPTILDLPRHAGVRGLTDLVVESRADVVVNCVGLVKQHPQISCSLDAIALNAMLPHQLAQCCRETGARLIHISTDCVFTGERALERVSSFSELAAQDDRLFRETVCALHFAYDEAHATDAIDTYGRTKALGEVADNRHVLTLRTSFVGRELAAGRSLLEWLIRQRGEVRGFVDHFWSGFTTLELARAIRRVIVDAPGLWGCFNLAADPVHKARLLEVTIQAFGLPLRVERVESGTPTNRTLDGSLLAAALQYSAPDLPAMLHEAAQDAWSSRYP